DDAGDGAGVQIEGERGGDGVVVGDGKGIGYGGGGDPGGGGEPQGGDAGARIGEEQVGVAMVTAGKFENPVAAGEASRQAYGGHRGLGAGVDEAEHLDVRQGGVKKFGEFELARSGGAEAGASRGGAAQGLDHRRRRVAQQQGAPGGDEIQVAVTVHIG